MRVCMLCQASSDKIYPVIMLGMIGRYLPSEWEEDSKSCLLLGVIKNVASSQRRVGLVVVTITLTPLQI